MGEGQVGRGEVQARVPISEQAGPGHPLHARVALGIDEGLEDLEVGLAKTGLLEPHGLGQAPEDLAVGQALAHGWDRGSVEAHVEVSVGLDDVPVFELGGRREQDIGVVRRVGGEVLEDHGEQVLAAQTLEHCALVWSDRGRVAVVDEEGVDRRPGLGRIGAPIDGSLAQVGLGEDPWVHAQGLAEPVHVEGPGLSLAEQVGAMDGVRVEVKAARVAQHDAAAALPPRAGQGRETGDGPRSHAPAAVALQAVVDADRRGCLLGVAAGEGADPGRRDTGDLGGPTRGPLGDPLAQALETQGPGFDVGVVEPIFGHQDVHEPQGQGCVGARTDRDPLVGGPGRAGTQGVDDDHLGGLGTLARALDQGPKVHVAGQGVGAPQQDQLGVGEVLRVHAHVSTEGVGDPLAARCGADGPAQAAGPEAMKEALGHGLALDQTHGPAVAVLEHGLGAVALDRGSGALADLGDGLGPADRLEAALTLGPHPAQGLAQALGVVGAQEVVVDLGAELALGDGVLGVTPDIDRPLGLDVDRDLPGTGVGAVVGAHTRDHAELRICAVSRPAHMEMLPTPRRGFHARGRRGFVGPRTASGRGRVDPLVRLEATLGEVEAASRHLALTKKQVEEGAPGSTRLRVSAGCSAAGSGRSMAVETWALVL